MALRSEPFHVMADVDIASHPSGVELMNVHCDCGNHSGWTADPVEAWEAQAMHELTAKSLRQRRPSNLGISL